MSTTSPGSASGGTVRELGLPARAVTALTRAGITTTEQLAALTRVELVAVNGLGPGSIAAIRRVVPEPPGRLRASGPQPEATAPDDEESPDAPAIPSFESLRSTRRRTTIDLIVPSTPPPADPDPAGSTPADPDPAGSTPTGPTPAAPRPPDYADLWRLGVRVGSVVATLPVRLTLCAVRAPARRLRHLLGA